MSQKMYIKVISSSVCYLIKLYQMRTYLAISETPRTETNTVGSSHSLFQADVLDFIAQTENIMKSLD
jgi:hypothetical protein